jgi:hypothetical protein
MSTKKTIQINPELFKLPGSKTKKNKDRKELPLNPIVTPNNLKNKLLKRIKEHKNKEITTTKPTTTTNNNTTYSDEYHGALDYLSELTKNQKINEAKQRMLNSRTLKNYQSLSANLLATNSPTKTNYAISLDLPPELQENKILIPQSSEVYNVNYKTTNDVPYGCLKNGKKQTYREWKQLSNPISTDIPDNVRPPTPPKKNIGVFLEGATNIVPPISTNSLSREERLEQIKNKLKKIQDHETQIKQQSLDKFKQIEQEYLSPLKDIDTINKVDEDTDEINIVTNLLKEQEEKKEKDIPKQYLKKIVKRTYTLGKSDKLRRVSILTNNRQTRKNIIDTQKELKKTTVTDVKKYLRQHGMIKVGSTCPVDILRKTFETAILTGEVTNTNKDTLLHNYLLADKV